MQTNQMTSETATGSREPGAACKSYKFSSAGGHDENEWQ